MRRELGSGWIIAVVAVAVLALGGAYMLSGRTKKVHVNVAQMSGPKPPQPSIPRAVD